MKKFQLHIKFEQKESWRISQVRGEEITLDATDAEIASFLLAEKNKDDFSATRRRPFIFKGIFDGAKRFVKFFRLSGRKEKIIQKQLKK